MIKQQATPQTQYLPPAELPGKTLNEQAEIGENVAALIEHPGFRPLIETMRLYHDSIVALELVQRVKPRETTAEYAGITGFLRGLSEVEPIAQFLIDNGKNAEARQRLAEDQGDS